MDIDKLLKLGIMEFERPLKVFELASKINYTAKEIITIANKLGIHIYSIKCVVEAIDAKKIYEVLELSQKPISFDEEVKKMFQQMKSADDLVNILNLVNRNLYGEKTIPLKLKFLTYHAFHSKNKYKEFEISKKTGGTRRICAPNKSLKSILSTLNKTFHYIHSSHASSHGFEKKKSVATNAAKHINKNYVYNIDLKDFFSNIKQARIHKKLQLAPFNVKVDIADLISNLVCYQSEDNFSIDEKIYKNDNYLAQGFPTSPLLSNIICERLDRKLTGLAKRFGVQYSRYADDITFSSNHNVYNEKSFQNELNKIITYEKFEINEKKTRLQKRGYRQEVTGITVNEKINVTKSYIKKLRGSIYLLEKFGIKETNNIFKRNKYIKNSKKNYALKYISGKLEYLKMIKGNDDSTYLKLKERFDNCIHGNDKKKKQKFHNPKKLINLLSSFTKDNNDLKFTTHNWDLQDECERFTSFDNFIEKIKVSWKTINNDLESLSPRLYAKIYKFLFDKKLGLPGDDTKINSWGQYNIKVGWSCPELKEWVDKGNSPFNYELKKEMVQEINNKTISTFLHVVEIFKHEIEIRTEHNDLKNLFYKQVNFLGPDFSIKLSNLEGVDFYTDVQWFEKALKHIFAEIKTRAEYPNIEIEVKKDINLEYVDIYITQFDSISNKTVHEMSKEVLDGNFQTIFSSLFSLCDWSIESNFLDGAYRINYLNNANDISILKLNSSPKGFTHILRFYK